MFNHITIRLFLVLGERPSFLEELKNSLFFYRSELVGLLGLLLLHLPDHFFSGGGGGGGGGGRHNDGEGVWSGW